MSRDRRAAQGGLSGWSMLLSKWLLSKGASPAPPSLPCFSSAALWTCGPTLHIGKKLAKAEWNVICHMLGWNAKLAQWNSTSTWPSRTSCFQPKGCQPATPPFCYEAWSPTFSFTRANTSQGCSDHLLNLFLSVSRSRCLPSHLEWWRLQERLEGAGHRGGCSHLAHKFIPQSPGWLSSPFGLKSKFPRACHSCEISDTTRSQQARSNHKQVGITSCVSCWHRGQRKACLTEFCFHLTFHAIACCKVKIKQPQSELTHAMPRQQAPCHQPAGQMVAHSSLQYPHTPKTRWWWPSGHGATTLRWSLRSGARSTAQTNLSSIWNSSILSLAQVLARPCGKLSQKKINCRHKMNNLPT